MLSHTKGPQIKSYLHCVCFTNDRKLKEWKKPSTPPECMYSHLWSKKKVSLWNGWLCRNIDKPYCGLGSNVFFFKRESLCKKKCLGNAGCKMLYLLLFREIHCCHSASRWNLEEAEAGEGWLYSTGRSASVSAALSPTLHVCMKIILLWKYQGVNKMDTFYLSRSFWLDWFHWPWFWKCKVICILFPSFLKLVFIAVSAMKTSL